MEDDVDSFRHLLEDGGLGGRVSGRKSSVLAYSQSQEIKTGYINAPSPSSPLLRAKVGTQRDIEKQTLTRNDINSRDVKGLTILHHAASSSGEDARAFAFCLIAHPLVDLYLQDFENGWTSLHRAFYFGNISIARAILERDGSSDANHSGQLTSLARVKDKEGHGPYDLLSTCIADRSLRKGNESVESDDDDSIDGPDAVNRSPDRSDEDVIQKSMVPPQVNVRADELFTFGSNRNFTLGLGDHDDRQYPERVHLRRPPRLFYRFYREHIAAQVARYSNINPAYAEKIQVQAKVPKDIMDLPDVIRLKPIMIQDVHMAKLHTAVLTSDPVANLYICGHGLGGRLGTCNENTLFNFACLDEFGSSRISSVALGQDHTLAVTDRGELYSWGSNLHGQLGCGLAKKDPKPEEVMQLSPKQIFGPMKKEVIIGVAASRIHSVAYSLTAIFTFGKNEGQLGLVDSQAGTLKVQSTPRQVQASRLSSSINSVSAIDRATVVLLENREVHVFANYGAVKISFPLEDFSSQFLRTSFRATKYDAMPNKIAKVTCGGDTICAMSTSGEIFTVTVDQRLDPSASSNVSTTNPNKIRAALSTPHRAWTLKSDRMAARDVGVDADGSIILSTEAGGVFRRVRRPKAVGLRGEQRANEFKFLRVPNLTRAVGVRASSSGAYCALREDCNVTRAELGPASKTIWKDVFGMLSFKGLAEHSPAPTFWQRPDSVKRIAERIARAQDVETEVAAALKEDISHVRSMDVLIRSTASEFTIPAHRVTLAARSPVLRNALYAHCQSGENESELFSIADGNGAPTSLTFVGLDFLTLFELVLYMYTDGLIGFWRLRHSSPRIAFRYKQVRAELMRIGTRLELRNLEAAARKVVDRPEPSMTADFELALLDASFYAHTDASVQLADGEVHVHSELLSRRCPFFEGLFQGHASGQWLSGRRTETAEMIEVDLSHVELRVFKLVLRYIYADAGEELFDDVVTADTDEFLDLVMEVLSVANELMLDSLSHTCQMVLGRYVTTRNACQLLNAVAPSSVQHFKDVVLEYLCLSLEPLLANHWLDELDEELLGELDDVVRENQQAAAPFVRSGHMEAELHEKYPELAEMILRAKQARLDALDIRAKHPDANSPTGPSLSRSRPSPAIQPGSPSSRTVASASIARTPTRDPTSPLGLEPLPSPAQGVSLSPNIEADPTVSSPPHTAAKPWGSSPMSGAKLGMKDIMAQASSSRTSNISLGLKSQALGERSEAASTAPKLSQKERKRQQQQQQQRTVSEQNISTSPALAAPGSSATSPWKTVTTSPRAALRHPSEDQITDPPKSTGSLVRPPGTPQLTMRQTIANAPAPKSQDLTPTPKPPSTPKQPQRSVSTPSTIPSSNKISNKSPNIPIQSIRHQPRPELPPEFHMNQSLADIMSHEQADKTTLKDAVAKRSLQEIQEEQAFQVSLL